MEYTFNFVFNDISTVKSFLMSTYNNIENVIQTNSQVIVIASNNENQVEISTYVQNEISKETVRNAISNAINFGNTLIKDFATENVLMGITQAGKTKAVADYLSDIMRYSQSGSLYEVINQIDFLISEGIPLDLSPFVTEARLLDFKQQIQNFLGV